MKKHFLFMPAMIAMAMCIGLAACGDDDPSDDSSGSGTGGSTPSEGTTPSTSQAMTPSEQKQYLDEVAQEFLNQIPAGEFKDLINLGN